MYSYIQPSKAKFSHLSNDHHEVKNATKTMETCLETTHEKEILAHGL